MSPQVNLSPSQSPLLRPFYPALDGLRAVAFLMVFCVHYVVLSSNFFLWKWGWVGVDLFFVLSGFLITGILFDALHSEHYFKNFYLRRALRIFPLFYGFWLLILILTPVLHVQWTRYLVAQAFYVGDLFLRPGAVTNLHINPGIIFIAPHHAGGPERMIMVGHFWSLCVEEQFYLIWPLVVFLVRSRRRLLQFCLFFCAAMPFVRLAYAHLCTTPTWTDGMYNSTQFRIDTLIFGAALALYLRGPSASPAVLRKYAWTAAVAGPATVAAIRIAERDPSVPNIFDPFVHTFGFSVIALTSAAFVLLAIDTSTWLYRALQFRPLVFLGRISYGLYVFHAIPIVAGARFAIQLAPRHLAWMVPVVAFVFSVVAAWLSFRFYETPFLRLKTVFAPQAPTTAAPVALVEPASLPLQPIAGAMRTAA